MKKFATSLFSILLILIFLTDFSDAQVVEEQLENPTLIQTYWLMAGIGGSTLGTFDASAISLTGAAAYRRGMQYFSVRSVWNSRNDKEQSYYDVGLLYGNVLGESDQFILAAGAGVSVVGGEYEMDSGDITAFNSVVGLPLEAQFRWKIRDRIGAGLYLFGNINSRVNFYGLSATLYFGKFERN